MLGRPSTLIVLGSLIPVTSAIAVFYHSDSAVFILQHYRNELANCKCQPLTPVPSTMTHSTTVGGYRQINKALNICAFEDYLEGQQGALPPLPDVEQISPRVLRVLGQNPGKVSLWSPQARSRPRISRSCLDSRGTNPNNHAVHPSRHKYIHHRHRSQAPPRRHGPGCSGVGRPDRRSSQGGRILALPCAPNTLARRSHGRSAGSAAHVSDGAD